MDGGQVWPSEPESGTNYAGARGGRFRKFLKGSVGKLRILPTGTRSGVGTRHGLRGAPLPRHGATSACGTGQGDPPLRDMGRCRHEAWAAGSPPTPSRGEPLQDAKRCQHGAQAAGSPPPGRGATLSGGTGCREHPQDMGRRRHGARAAGSPPGPRGAPAGCKATSAWGTGRGEPPPAPRMRSGVGKRARPGLGADARHRHRHRRRLSADPRATASSAPKT